MSPASSMALHGRIAVLSLLAHCLVVPSSSAVDFIYNGFQHAADLSLDGSASILRGGALQLTNDSTNLMGHAFLVPPVPMLVNKAVVSFSTAFVFDIVTVGRGGGHGLAFVVAASKVLPGASAEQYLGLLGKGNLGNSSNHVFAVEFDTVQASGLLNETNGNHVGVDLNSLVSTLSEPAGYFTDDDGRNVSVPLESAQPIQAWVEYDGRARVLNVTIAPASVPTRPHRPLISHAIDLTAIFKQDIDVFAFGGLLLEAASGRRPINPVTGVNLVRWVRDHGVKGDLVRAVDDRLDGWYDKEEARLVLWLGLACSQWQPQARPSMRQVCQYLDGEEEMQDDAVLLLSDVDSIDFGSLESLTWSSCATMSAGSLRGGR
ncbi:hypothetical protein ACQ4PT_071790 [Festuca glaucescens]